MGNIVDFELRRLDPRKAAEQEAGAQIREQFERLRLMLGWSVEMRRQGLMPDEVAQAFYDYFQSK
jgi:hypothetical protein